jgi:O-antigen ligase
LLERFGGAGLPGLAVLGVAAVVAILLVDRFAREPEFSVRGLYFESGLGLIPQLAATFSTLSALAIPGFQMLRTLVFLVVTGLTVLRARWDAAGSRLWGAAVAVPIGALVTDSIVGVHFFVERRLFLALGVTALWLAPRMNVAMIARLAKLVLGAYLLASTIAFVLGMPDATSPYAEASSLPSMDERVNGVFPHANALGPAALLYLLVDWIRPSPRWLRLSMNPAAAVLLLLSQSKTAWVAAVVVATVLVASRWEPRHALAGITLLAAIAFPLVIFLGLQPGDTSDELTFTGRTELWELGIEEWRDSPIVGQGSAVFRGIAEETGRDWTGQAHNEFVQALAENGLIGATLTVIYTIVLVQVALRLAPRSGNASLALVVLLLLRSMTETPMISFSIEHMTILGLLFAWEREARHERANAEQPVAATRPPVALPTGAP